MSKPDKNPPGGQADHDLIVALQSALDEHFASDKKTLETLVRLLRRNDHRNRARFVIIMEAIDTFAAAVNAAFDSLGTAVDGVSADVDFLKAEIVKLQNSPGTLTPADQATLDGIQTRANALAEKVKALDAATEQPPTPPTT